MLAAMAMAATGSDHEVHARSTILGWALLCGLGCATTPAPAPPIAATPSAPTEPAPTEATAPPTELPAPRIAAPPEPEIQGYTPEVAAVLAEQYLGFIGPDTKIAVSRRGAVRLLPDGPELGLRDRSPFAAARRLQVLEDAERPRVVIDDGAVRLMLYVDREDARPVLLRAAPLRPDPQTTFGDPPTRGHAVLQPGAWVDVLATDGAMAQVSYGEPASELSGWIEADALGTTFTFIPPPPADQGEDQDVRDSRVKRATKLLTRPGGKTLATLEKDDPVSPLLPSADKGYRLVRYRPACESGFVYVGFVRQSDLYTPDFGTGTGCFTGSPSIPRVFGEAESAPRTTLPPGRILLDVDSPTVVGCIHDEVEVAELGDERYAVATVWGPVPVRLAPRDFHHGQCATSKRRGR